MSSGDCLFPTLYLRDRAPTPLPLVDLPHLCGLLFLLSQLNDSQTVLLGKQIMSRADDEIFPWGRRDNLVNLCNIVPILNCCSHLFGSALRDAGILIISE